MRSDIDVTAAHGASEARLPTTMDSLRGALERNAGCGRPGRTQPWSERSFEYLIWENAP